MTNTTKPLTDKRYNTLLRDIQQLLRTADAAADQQKVAAYWHLGERIEQEHIATTAGYHNSILRDLAADSRVAVRTLQYAVRFHTTFPRLPARPLAWSKYRVLSEVKSADDRDRYHKIAVDTGLPVRGLIALIASDKSGSPPGKPRLARPTQASYLYSATVHNIVDGDTLDLDIDLGFHTLRRGRFRLASIDCPEMNTPEGRQAKNFTIKRLLAAETVVVKTIRVDLHGRYVAHLFYSERAVSIDTCFEEGTHLNNELVTAQHAEIVMG